MSFITPLVEYLLAYERPGGGKLCQMGALQVTVPFYPDLTYTYEITPLAGNFCNIYFGNLISQHQVPGAITADVYHQDMALDIGTQYGASLSVETAGWTEITMLSPLHTVWSNISDLVQFTDEIMVFLIFKSQADLAVARELIRTYAQPSKGIPDEILTAALQRYALEPRR